MGGSLHERIIMFVPFSSRCRRNPGSSAQPHAVSLYHFLKWGPFRGRMIPLRDHSGGLLDFALRHAVADRVQIIGRAVSPDRRQKERADSGQHLGETLRGAPSGLREKNAGNRLPHGVVEQLEHGRDVCAEHAQGGLLVKGAVLGGR